MARLIECIPNFSCSKEKDEATYNELVKTAQSVPGCTLFDAQTDGNHNRCVFTLIGSPEAIEEVAFQLTKVATERIDMNKHHGEVAKKIAKVIRGSSGGFRSCKAMGFMLEDRGIAQVSMNMVNYEDTPLYVTYEMIKALAERYGTRVIESEIVGLTPAKALIDCAEFYLKAKDFDCKKQVMEYHLIDME